MRIQLPPLLTYQALKKLVSDNYKTSFSKANNPIVFDWTSNNWIGLPEAVIVLSWSSSLVTFGCRVEWLVFEPLTTSPALEQLRGQAAHKLGSENFMLVSGKIHKLNKDARNSVLTSKKFTTAKNEIRELSNVGEYKADLEVKTWLDTELGPLRRLKVLSYMHRYRLFERAFETGVVLQPNGSAIPGLNIPPASDTACLELRRVTSLVEVGSLVDKLNHPAELERILGQYAGLDIARGGALNNILVAELGSNIEDHAKATAAWIWTRLVLDEQVTEQTADDPVVKSFQQQGRGFLELNISDNGVGLINQLDAVLDRDRRTAAVSKYRDQNYPREVKLIDYAFDRLSSSKRDIVELVHFENDASSNSDKGNLAVVSSGLYWVWNVVRSHRGILSICTAGYSVWYDFTHEDAPGNFGKWSLTFPAYEMLGAPLKGTAIRICFPLIQSHDSEVSSLASFPEQIHRPIPEPNFSFVWAGDVVRDVPIWVKRKKTKKGNEGIEGLPGMFDTHEVRVLHELQNKHFPLSDGDVLVLDLCGVRSQWVKKSVAPLCQFVLEMNYTSTIGRSAVVLWNVPASSEAVFETAVKLGDLFEKRLETANTKHSHLKELRRAVLLIFDDGRIRIFCGWKEAEEILNRLRIEGELDLDEIGAGNLEESERKRLSKLITENAHMFEWTGRNRVSLRIWPTAIRIKAWAQGINWFNSMLDKSVKEGGVHLVPSTGYFRLPSTGYLVKEFYQFRGLVASQEACAKLAWHISQIIDAIGYSHNPQSRIHLVSVSRPAMALAHHLNDNYYYEKSGVISNVIADRTIEEIEAEGGNPNIEGSAILLTDVISSGRMCERIARSFPKLQWLGTIGLLETRYEVRERIAKQRNGIETFEIDDTATGKTFALAVRKVQKFNPRDLGPVHATAIDEVNMCAVQSSDRMPDTVEKFWTFVHRKPEAIRIGHYIGNNHHYIYKVDVGELLDATNSLGQSLLDFIVKHVSSALMEKSYDADRTVIMHPPFDHSYAERIAKAIQDTNGILFRHILYKDNFAGHWRFSPFVQHGLPLDDCTLVLIDDGTNTGETLMGLLDAASFGSPKEVVAYVGITRMPPHKNHLFTNLKSLHGVKKNGTIKIEFMLGLSIPVYSPRECPICMLTSNLTALAEKNSLVTRYAWELVDSLRPPAEISEVDGSGFLWTYSPATKLSITELREALETLDYHGPSAELVEATLNQVLQLERNDILLNLAFIICAEPELISATIFAPYIDSTEQALIRVSLQALTQCQTHELMTFVGFAFHLMSRAYQRSPTSDPSLALNAFWSAILQREDVSTSLLGRIISFVLAQIPKDNRTASKSGSRNVGWRLLKELKSEVTPRDRPREIGSLELSRAFAYLFVREALESDRPFSLANQSESGHSDFYDLATIAASHFWKHASDHIRADIDLLSEAIALDDASVRDRLYSALHSLVVSFNKLYELKERIREVERRAKSVTNEVLGMPNWDSPELNHALARFMRLLVKIAEEISSSSPLPIEKLKESLNPLQGVWEDLESNQLDPAFDELFPRIHAAIARKWGRFAREFGFPYSVAQPLPRDSSLSDVRVFMPRKLLLRFLNATLQNLKSAAFAGWSSEDIKSAAKARIEIEVNTSTQVATVRVVDNGPMRPQKKEAGDQLGLKNVQKLVGLFGAELMLPQSTNDRTWVELRMKTRDTGNPVVGRI